MRLLRAANGSRPRIPCSQRGAARYRATPPARADRTRKASAALRARSSHALRPGQSLSSLRRNLQAFSQLDHTEADASLNGSERLMKPFGELVLGKAGEVSELDGFTLFRRQRF